MRKVSLAVTLVLAPFVYADQQFSVFLTPEEVTHSESTGTSFSGGIGVSWAQRWTPRFTTELSLSAEQSYEEASTTIQGPSGPFTTYYKNRVQSYPFDVLAQYHFVNGSNWTPYVGGGLRYLTTDSTLANNRTSVQLNGGVVWQFSPHWGMRFDLKQLLNEDEYYDRASKGSFGFSWHY